MAKIVIIDLPDSLELDQEAMSSIMGGARTQRQRVVRYRPKFSRRTPSSILQNAIGREKPFGVPRQ